MIGVTINLLLVPQKGTFPFTSGTVKGIFVYDHRSSVSAYLSHEKRLHAFYTRPSDT